MALPEEGERQTEVAAGASAAAAAVGGVVGGAGGAGNAGRLAVARSLSCEVEDVDLGQEEPLDIEFSPTGLAVGGGPQRYFVGAVVWNHIIIAGFACFAAAWAVLQRAVAEIDWSRAFARARMPGVVFLPTLFLLQGSSLAAANLVLYHEGGGSGWRLVLGLLGSLLSLGLAPAAYFGVLRPRSLGAVASPDPRLRLAVDCYEETELPEKPPLQGWRRTLYYFLFGPGIWVPSTVEREWFVEQYGLMFENYRSHSGWFAAAELTHITCVSVLAAWKPGSMAECNARNFLLSAVMGAYAAVVVLRRPYMSPLDNIVGGALAVSAAVAVLAISVAIALQGRRPSEGLMQAALRTLLLSAVLFMIKGVYDVLLYVGDLRIGRRQKARDAARGAARATFAEAAELLEPLSPLQADGRTETDQSAGAAQHGSPRRPHISDWLCATQLQEPQQQAAPQALTPLGPSSPRRPHAADWLQSPLLPPEQQQPLRPRPQPERAAISAALLPAQERPAPRRPHLRDFPPAGRFRQNGAGGAADL